MEYKGYYIHNQLPARQHPNATALLQISEGGITIKCLRYKVNYEGTYVEALKKAEAFIDKRLCPKKYSKPKRAE